ncbi:alpha/beta hydrolase [Methylobacterium sp. Leaf118]|uniref:alpha/beta hydrolase n=1 Tax=Methylobacterium sp. Leaf118 TaxID=2876562 RepID=UPI001E37E157|nr:alpha/beta hydrolase [Methylobacterium sp. Leaf118]
MRLLAFLVLVGLGLYGAGVLALAFGQRHLLYPGAWMAMPPAAAPAGTETLILTTSDGQRLHALWRPPRPGCGVVVSFHGNASRPEPHARRFAEGPWRRGGWGVLAPAYRGYPGSTGDPSEAGLIRDGLAAYAAATERAPGAPILLHGHSLGSAVAVAVGERVTPLGLYLEAPFDSLSHLARLRYPLVPTGWLLADTYRSDQRIAAGTAPVLIVQGQDDPVVPAKLARRLADAAGPRATFDLIPGDHVSILGHADGQVEARFRAGFKDTCEAPALAVQAP